MNVLVTGANGYLGAWVCDLLQEHGHLIFPMDSHGRPVGNTIVEDYRLIDAVAHLGWYSRAGNDDPDAQDYCVGQTDRLIAMVRKCRATPAKLVFTSTASVYPQVAPSDTETAWGEDTSPVPSCAYTAGKAAGESLVRNALPGSHLILRLGSLMGVGCTANRGRTKLDVVVNAFASDAYRSGKIEVWHPSAWKPVLHVQDAARIVVEGLERRGWVGTVNAAVDCPRAIEIATKVAYHTGAEIKVIDPPKDGPPSTMRSCRVDCTKMKEELPDLRLKALGEAIYEFRDYTLGPWDITLPW